MKNLVLVFMMMIMVTPVMAQEMETKYDPYISLGVSATNAEDFKETAFARMEIGVRKQNTAVGLVIGRNNLAGIGDAETIENYFYEGKVSLFHDFGMLEGYVLGGLGSEFSNPGLFIEYGAGVNKHLTNNVSTFLQLSNFNTTNFLTGGVIFTIR